MTKPDFASISFDALTTVTGGAAAKKPKTRKVGNVTLIGPKTDEELY